MKRLKYQFTFFTLLKHAILLLSVFITLYPFIYMLAVSTSSSIYVLRGEVSFYPRGFNFEVYKVVFLDKNIFDAYLNTVLYTAVGTVISLSITCAGAYSLSKNRMIWSRFFSIMILLTMFFSGGLIPTYITVKNLGMRNTMWAVIIPGAISTWNLLIMRTFFRQFPAEIEESGKLDGLTDLGVFLRLVLPLSTAVLATIGLFYAVGIWNAYFGPMIYLDDTRKFPLQLILRNILMVGLNNNSNTVGASGDSVVVDESIKYATIIVSIVPIIAVYPFIQRYFVKGVMVGSLKG
jgi:putative aldouronate transport system permease protein